MCASSDNLVAVGRISGTHGVKGQLRLYSYSGNFESLQNASDVILNFPSGTSSCFQLLRTVCNSGRFLISIGGVDTIDEAQKLIGCELFLKREQLPATGNDEYYWQDLLGIDVVTDNGLMLGKIAEIMETGANDVYLVREGTGLKEYLIPAISSVIKNVNIQAGVMTITPLDGLLDL